MNKPDLVTNAPREALTAYSKLDGPDTALAIVALFGVTQLKRFGNILQGKVNYRSWKDNYENAYRPVRTLHVRLR